MSTIVCQEESPDLKRFHNHLKIFRDVLSNITTEGAITPGQVDLVEVVEPTTSQMLTSDYGATKSSEARFSILPVGPLPNPVNPPNHDWQFVTITSTIEVPKPIESGVLEEIVKSLFQQHLKLISTTSEGVMSQTSDVSHSPLPTASEPTETLSSDSQTSINAPITTVGEPDMGMHDFITKSASDGLIEPVFEAAQAVASEPGPGAPKAKSSNPKNGMMKQIAKLKSSNRIQIRPQFRHHKLKAPALGGIYAKPKTAWYGNYARKSTQTERSSTEKPSATEVTIFSTTHTPVVLSAEIPEASTGPSHTEIGRFIELLRAKLKSKSSPSTQGNKPEESWASRFSEPSRSTTFGLGAEETSSSCVSTSKSLPEGISPPTFSFDDLGFSHKHHSSASPDQSESPSTSATPIKSLDLRYVTTVSHIPRPRGAAFKTRVPLPPYATVQPRSPEEIRSSRMGSMNKTRNKPPYFYDIFANKAVPPMYPSTIGIIVFAFFVAFL